MKFTQLESDYVGIRLPEAFRWAVEKSKEAELLIYQVLTKCTEECEDVAISLDRRDLICNFLRNWKAQGHLSSNALRYEEDESVAVLSCTFDIYKIKEDLEFVNDCFGTINFGAVESALDSCNIDISDERVAHLEASIQKVKRPDEVSLQTSKKDN